MSYSDVNIIILWVFFKSKTPSNLKKKKKRPNMLAHAYFLKHRCPRVLSPCKMASVTISPVVSFPSSSCVYHSAVGECLVLAGIRTWSKTLLIWWSSYCYPISFWNITRCSLLCCSLLVLSCTPTCLNKLWLLWWQFLLWQLSPKSG